MAEPRRGLGKFLERQGAARPTAPIGTEAVTPPAAQTNIMEASGVTRRGGDRTGRRATKDGREQLLIYLRPEGIKELKLAALDGDTTASAIVADAVNAWFQRHGRPPVA